MSTEREEQVAEALAPEDYRHPLDKPAASIREALDREYPEAVKEPCNDCPWRREALPGWLGPMSAAEWIEVVHGEAPIACHKTLNGSSWEGASQCRGAAIFRENVCKSPMNPSVAVGPRDEERVFGNSIEFLEHHGSSIDEFRRRHE